MDLDLMKQALIKKYARVKGISEEEAKSLLEPIMGDKDKIQELLDVLQLIDSIETKPNSISDEIKEVIKSKALIKLGEKTIEDEEDDIEEIIKKAMKWKKQLDLVEKILGGSSEDPRIIALEQKFNDLKESLNSLVNLLRNKEENEVTKEIVNSIKALNENIQKQIEAINKRIEKLEHEGGIPDIDKIKRQLEKIGWRVQPPGSEEFDLDAIKKKLEKYGFKIEPGFLTWDKVKEILEEERKKWEQQIRKDLEKEIERDRVEATKETLITGFKVLGEVLKDVLKPVTHKMLKETTEELSELMSEEDSEEKELEEAISDFESKRKRGEGEEESYEEEVNLY